MISDKAYNKATKGFSKEEMALAKGYKELVNSKDRVIFASKKSDEKIGKSMEELFSKVKYIEGGENGITEKSANAETTFGQALSDGGMTIKDDTKSGLYYVFILEDRVQMKNDYYSKTTETQMTCASVMDKLCEYTNAMITNHEIGHVLGYIFNSPNAKFLDAIQFENLGENIRGQKSYYRNGSLHGNTRDIKQSEATGIPDFLK